MSLVLPEPGDGEFTQVPTLALQELLGLLELQKLQGQASAPERTAAKWYDDPLGFVDNCIAFPEPRRRGPATREPGLAPYQREIIASVPEKLRVAVRGPRGLGKTTLASMVILWFALTREMAGVDWKIMTTAGSWSQLKGYLWPEIRKWARCVDWGNVGRSALSERTELQQHGMKLRAGLADAASPDDPAKIEGMHGDSILLVVDEAKLVGPEMFESAEGAFSGADEETGLEAYALCISTPGEPAGPFYGMHRRAPEWEDWHPRHVTLEECMAAGRISRKWAAKCKRLWGESSAVYQNHVLGEFCSNDEDAIVPLAWVEAAIDRWREWDAAGRPDPGDPHLIGVDVASTGPDKSVAAVRHGNVVTALHYWPRGDTMATAGRVAGLLNADPLAKAVIDVIGVGAGVYDRLREQGRPVEAFDVRRKTTRKDVTGQFGFARIRDAAWHNLREALDPARGATLALPPDDQLTGDLTALHFQHMSDGKVHVEEKDAMRKRLGRSPDAGDAVVAAVWAAQGSFLDVYGLTRCPDEACGRTFAAEADGRRRERCPYCQAPLDGDPEAPSPQPQPAAPPVPRPAAPAGVQIPIQGGLAGLRAFAGRGFGR